MAASATKVWINGTYHDKLDAKISVYDHGLLYGDGIFEGMRIYSGKVFKHKQHIDRLFESAQAIAMTIPMSKDEIIKAVEDTVKMNSKIDGYIRLIVTRGVGTLGLDPRKCSPNVIVIVDDISLYPRERRLKPSRWAASKRSC
jgi:branched-chain amino acid aminotransferase